jgi:hypothetical protein
MQVGVERSVHAATTREPIIAWRAWTLTGRADATGLRLRPVAGRRLPWPPMRPAQAACKNAKIHRAPDFACSCGLHGTHSTDALRRTKNPTVLGTVALWGRVIEHELGYRAEFAYPQRVRLVCLLCFWQRGPHGAVPEGVAVIDRGRMLPLCGNHLTTAVHYGLRSRRTLDAAEVQSALQATYAVDMLG